MNNRNKMKMYFSYMNKKKWIGMFLGVFIIIVLSIILPTSFAALEPVKSITILSETTNYVGKESGSWQVEKSAKWIKKGVAEITFDVDTVLKESTRDKDVLFVLDVSGSMNGDELNKVKSDTIDLLNTLLSNNKNKAGLITFSDMSTIVSDFTNDKDSLVQKVNSLVAAGSTNYYQALVNVDTILKKYKKEQNKDCIVLFLTDGYPNVDVPNEQAQYRYLKSEYPDVVFNGVQYEMGTEILDPIKQVSDNQYIADMKTLNNVLFSASTPTLPYENFEITDFIDTNYFYVDSSDDIKVSEGKIVLDKNAQTIHWKMDNLQSGQGATMTIHAKLKEEFIGKGGVYPTNKKEEIKSKIGTNTEDVISPNTPVLADNYKVSYEGNAPTGCSVKNVPATENKSVFDVVEVKDKEPTCEGYEFKGWEVITEDVTMYNKDYFIMPHKDVVLKATWAKVTLEKSMNGEIFVIHKLYDMMNSISSPDDKSSEFVTSSTGIDFSKAPSNTNGKGVYQLASSKNEEYPILYYRGAVKNNNVKFGGFCWKIVRTTATGGIKLVYNGKPDSNGYCTNTTGEATQIGTSEFNDSSSFAANIGYMYGDATNYALTSSSPFSSEKTLVFGNDVEWDGSKYILKDTKTIVTADWSSNYQTIAEKYHYTCLDSTNSCAKVKYLYVFSSSRMFYNLPLENGKNIEQAKKEIFANTNDSIIKSMIDNWYQENMVPYTKWLEDTIWCNDRSFYEGPLKSKDEDASVNLNSVFGPYGRNVKTYKPSVVCPNVSDSFTVNSKNGNGALTYPVALLTADEMTLAGHGWSGYSGASYLYTNQDNWTMSPRAFASLGMASFFVDTTGKLYSGGPKGSHGVRPAISLAPDSSIASGDGTAQDPYTIA